MSDYDLIWNKTVQIFPILNKTLSHTDYTPEDFQYVTTELNRLGIVDNIYETIFLEIDCILRQQIVPQFWKYFHEDCDTEKGFYQFQLGVYELHKEFTKVFDLLKRVQLFKQSCHFNNSKYKHANLFYEFNELLKSTLLAQLPANFNDIVYSFYNVSFNVFANSHQGEDDNEEEMDEIKCSGCGKESDNCRCQELVCAFNKTNQYLTNMDLLDRLAGYTLTTLIQARISSHVLETSKVMFSTSHIKGLENWLETIVLNWLTRIFNRGSLKINDEDTKIKEVIQEFKIKLSYHLYETFAKSIIDQFFHVIIEYPDSQPAIDDLKLCLVRLDLRKYLINQIKQALETKLLQPGAITSDILVAYVAAIKAIRHLDSTGVLLDTVTEPVKEYLRSRSDTVRCVVTELTEEGLTDLNEELSKSEHVKKGTTGTGNNEMVDWEKWQPDPVDANPSKTARSSRSSDIISMVVDIYGSKDLFVNEYKNLLAERLLMNLHFNPIKDIRNLELLKLRFGENLLHSCEVMLKDISDSKRISQHIESEAANEKKHLFPMSAFILSSQFWPPFNKESIELPDDIQYEFDRYTKSYEAHKGNRTLIWRPVTGRVELTIDIGEKKLDMTVTPTQACIIYVFQDQTEWHLDDLCEQFKAIPSVLRKRIAFWQAQGIIKEKSKDVFVLVEDGEAGKINDSIDYDMHSQELGEDDEDNESAMASASDQREEELQVFWSYIVGMLTNLDSLPLERIHQMLKMFASHGPGVEFSQEELKNFLQRKVREHELVFAGGVYHLNK